MIPRTASLLLPLLTVAACGTPPAPDDAGPGYGRPGESHLAEAGAPGDPVTAPWTEAFLARTLLVADTIHVSGPKGLLAHCAVTQDNVRVAYDVETVPEGLRQTAKVKVPGAEVRAQLDAWQLVATKRLITLEQPGDVPVVVTATGNAWYRPVEGVVEERGEELRYVGEIR